MKNLKNATYNNEKSISEAKEEFLEDFDIGETIGELKITLGIGSYAVVKLAKQKKTEKLFAIKFYDRVKLLDPVKMKNYEAEVENLMSLSHPNIIKLESSFQGKRKFVMVMEYVGKDCLYDILENSALGVMSEEYAAGAFYQILAGLKYTHESGVVHRDLKLQNIIVGDEQQVKVIFYKEDY